MWAAFQASQMRRRIVSISYCNTMCDAAVQYSDAGTLVKRQEHLPLLLKLADHIFRRQVKVDLHGGEPIVAQKPLQGGQGDALLNRRDREGVVQNTGDVTGHAPTPRTDLQTP